MHFPGWGAKTGGGGGGFLPQGERELHAVAHPFEPSRVPSTTRYLLMTRVINLLSNSQLLGMRSFLHPAIR
jgi:hypothetical protein